MMPPTLYTYPMLPQIPMPAMATSNTTWISVPTAPQMTSMTSALPHAMTAPVTYHQPIESFPMLMPAEATSPGPGPTQSVVAAGLNMVPNQTMYPMSVTTRMEVVWHTEFEGRFTNRYPHAWCLNPVISPPDNAEEYNLFQDSAKVRFHCNSCGRGWTSMKGRVAFWFKVNPLTNNGEVLFKLYGQCCQRCSKDEVFSHAMWYPEEVVKVIENLHGKIASVYYGMSFSMIRFDRRGGKPRAQHDAALCQACKDGICKEGWVN